MGSSCSAAPGRALPGQGQLEGPRRGNAVLRLPVPNNITPPPAGSTADIGHGSSEQDRKGDFLTCQHPVGGSHAWAPAGPAARAEAEVAGPVLLPTRPSVLRCQRASALCTARPPCSRVRHFLFVIQSLRCFFASRGI